MASYIARRLLLFLPTVVGATIVVFILIRLLPGDAIDTLITDNVSAGPALRAQLRSDLGLNEPAPIQYLKWVGGVAHGNFGRSLLSQKPTAQMLAPTIRVTIQLIAVSILIALAVAIPLGVMAAVKQDTPWDYVSRLLAIGWLSVPSFVVGTAIVILPAIWWQYSAPLEYGDSWTNPWLAFRRFAPAAVALGLALSGVTMRMVRSSMLEVLREDYVRTARAKGLRERSVVYRHALKNAFIPVLTVVSQQIGVLMGGTVIIERIFNLPGVGSLTVSSIQLRDYTQLQTNILFLSLVFVSVTLITDLAYTWLDPRIRY